MIGEMDMKEYICLDCEQTFTEDEIVFKTYYERHEIWGAIQSVPVTEQYCPHCHSEDFEDYIEPEEDEDE